SNKSELIIVDQLEKGDKRSLYSINVHQDFCLNTTFPMVLFVGEDRIYIYNQMWVQILQGGHPCIGTSATLTFPEARDVIVPMFDA
ncbi:643_t:CDS:2, partial [Paraglomus brasilianum]